LFEQRIEIRYVVRIDRDQAKVVPAVIVHLVVHFLGVASLCVGEPPVFDVGVELREQEVGPEPRPSDDETVHERRLVLVGDSMPGEPVRNHCLGLAPDEFASQGYGRRPVFGSALRVEKSLKERAFGVSALEILLASLTVEPEEPVEET
jgi:hypothetical protein